MKQLDLFHDFILTEVCPLNILVGCEESQAVTIELRKRGHNAFSCDLQECSGGHPEWHLKMDIFKAIRCGMIVTQSGELVEIKSWGMMICFPTCTYLTVSANKWYKEQPARKSGTLVGKAREEAREEALNFVAKLMNCDIPKIAIENPVGVIGSRIFWYSCGIGPDRWEVFPKTLKYGGRKPDQIIQPWMFGHGETKPTCLWLKGLPNLNHTNIVDGREQRIWKMKPSYDRTKLRSKTYTGIAEAMAEQWAGTVLKTQTN